MSMSIPQQNEQQNGQIQNFDKIQLLFNNRNRLAAFEFAYVSRYIDSCLAIIRDCSSLDTKKNQIITLSFENEKRRLRQRKESEKKLFKNQK